MHPAPVPDKPALFILAHATGSAARYAEAWPRLASRCLAVPLDLPGHGGRRGEPLLHDMEAIREDLAARALEALAAAGRGPGAKAGSPRYYVFGHSMGAVSGYVMSERLMAAGIGPPCRFFASSFSVPGWHPIPPGMAELEDGEMWRVSAERFGMLEGRALPDPGQMETHSPVYRADLKAVEGYRPASLTALPRVTVFYAENDMVDAALAARWAGASVSPPEIIRVEGGHFHPLERPARLEALILERI